jgi:hypothetical protein
MKKMNLYVRGLINAGLGGVYIVLASLFVNNVPKLFGPESNGNGGILGFSVFLMFFVLSASVMSALILGKPVMMYMDGEKKGAVKLLGITLGWIFVFMIAILLLKIAI